MVKCWYSNKHDIESLTGVRCSSLNKTRTPKVFQCLCQWYFRQHKIAIVTEIVKIFLQVGLKTDPRDVARFCWLKYENLIVPTEISKNFAFVSFEGISNTFLLKTTTGHLSAVQDSYLGKVERWHMWAINITDVNSVDETIRLNRKSKTTFHYDSMALREWCREIQ